MTGAPVSTERLSFHLNGRPVDIGAPSGHVTLLDFLRSSGLTGSKEGCAEGECGACTVALVVPHAGGSAYRAVNSCLVSLPSIADHEVYTIESLADGGQLADAQRALAAAGGSQCGYCTPGFVMSLFAEQYRRDRTGPCDPAALGGNLCRCTGYRPIRDAVREVGSPPAGHRLDRLSEPAPTLRAVSSASFSRPATIAAAVRLLRERPDAAILAGGTDVMVDSNLRGRHPSHMVSLDAIDELRGFSESSDRVVIGAGLALSDLERQWRSAPAALHEWFELFASPLIRNRATLGGNLATASPIGDSAPLLLALDATVHIAGADGTRQIALADFFLSYRKTALDRDEIVTAIEVPKPLPAILRFYKVSKRRLDDISTVAAGMALDLDGTRVARIRLAFGGMAATPIRLTAAESAVTSSTWDENAVTGIAQAIEEHLSPLGDHRGSREYRLAVAASLVERFWWETRS